MSNCCSWALTNRVKQVLRSKLAVEMKPLKQVTNESVQFLAARKNREKGEIIRSIIRMVDRSGEMENVTVEFVNASRMPILRLDTCRDVSE